MPGLSDKIFIERSGGARGMREGIFYIIIKASI
jgi:hypothetical protein